MFILHAQLAHHSPSFDWLARWVDWNWNAFSLVGNILLHLYDTHIWIATTNITLCWREYTVACSFTRLEHTAAIKMMLCSFCCPFNLLSGVIYLYIKTFLCLVWEPVTDFGLRLQFWSVSLLLMLEWGSTDDCPDCPIFHVMPVTLGAGNSERQQCDALWLLLCCCCECVMGMNRIQSNVVMHSVLISFVRHWS